ncbi:MAG: hypothetical protein A3G75_10200 [Verrucomicrobia bacterium RIFCSPLOWO2_12_FULL_64_8]|nr:MAG: hypothetical protein A3G75_10200 [Verrucomicrobia bacterium RIFCSPLOWO2_12_FULL_64_8]
MLTAMLSDRHYMRDVGPERPFDLIKWLMAAFVALFLLQHVAEKWFQHLEHYSWFGLVADNALHVRKLWTLFTYNFLQNTAGYSGGVFTLICNLLGLYFCGLDLRDRLGQARLAWLYAGFIAAGAIAWCAVYPLGVDWPLFTPFASFTGLFVLFCCHRADEKMTFLVFFILPATMKPKYFCWCWVALDLFGFLFYEMGGRVSPLWNGHAANLAAALAAFACYRVSRRADFSGGFSNTDIELPRWLRRQKKSSTRPPAYKVNVANRGDLRAEVDRILDKINSEGFGALTDEERRLLDDARDLLSRR